MLRVVSTALIVLVVAATALAVDMAHLLSRPVGLDEPVQLIVPPGSSFHQVVARLYDAGVLSVPRASQYLTAYAWWRGDAARVKSGEFRIDPAASPAQILAMLVAGRTVRHQITLIEGWTFDSLRAALAGNDAIRHTLADADDEAVMAAIGAAGQSPEGRFLPETYYFPRGTTDVALLRRAHHAMSRTLEAQWAARAPELPLDGPYQALILASIVEKETAVPDERMRVAGVFIRRLRSGMRLQSDPTVIYGLDDFHGNLTRADLRRDGPYNTYTRTGLPPTPIAMPGAAAIHAALHPADGEALYFVARGDGTHAFSATYAEHKKAVNRYQLQ